MSKETDQIRILTEVNKKLLDLFATTIPKTTTAPAKAMPKPVLKKVVAPKPKTDAIK